MAPLLLRLPPGASVFRSIHNAHQQQLAGLFCITTDRLWSCVHQRRGFCSAASKSNTSTEDEVGRVMEQANRALEKSEVFHTDFLTPIVRKDCLASLKKVSGVGAVASGGYAEAERSRLSIGPEEMIQSAECDAAGYPGAVSALSVSGKFGFDPADHGDFLGAILGTGIVREKVGDIIVLNDRGAHFLVVPELINYLITSLKQVRTISVECKEIPVSELEIQPPRTKTIKSVEASLRLDAVASAGFKLSRSKLADLISKGEVEVNWKEATKSSTPLRTGDVVSLAGKGRLQIGEIETTKKGKFAIQMSRFL